MDEVTDDQPAEFSIAAQDIVGLWEDAPETCLDVLTMVQALTGWAKEGVAHIARGGCERHRDMGIDPDNAAKMVELALGYAAENVQRMYSGEMFSLLDELVMLGVMDMEDEDDEKGE